MVIFHLVALIESLLCMQLLLVFEDLRSDLMRNWKEEIHAQSHICNDSFGEFFRTILCVVNVPFELVCDHHIVYSEVDLDDFNAFSINWLVSLELIKLLLQALDHLFFMTLRDFIIFI